MSVQQGVLTNITGAIFNVGYMSGTRSGGVTNAIQFGALQNVELNVAYQNATLTGPESLSPLGVGTQSETLTGTFTNGVVTVEQFFMACGGQMSYDGATNRTTWTKLVNQERKSFDLELVSEAGADPAMKVNVYRCVADNWKIYGGDNRTWNLGSGGFTVYGEADGGRLVTISMPGSLHNAS